MEELVQIFLATDVASIMQNFGKTTRQQDPVVHFYETFLANSLTVINERLADSIVGINGKLDFPNKFVRNLLL